MKEIVSQIWHSASARNVGKLLSANIIAQAIGILVYPVLTRMYGAEDFALLSLFTSIVTVIVLIANGEYHYAIVLPKEESKAKALVFLCMLLVAGVAVLLCLFLPFSRLIATLFKAPDLAHWLWALPICVAALGVWNILNYWYIRRAAFTRISGYQVTQSVFTACTKIGFGALGWLQGGMILATVIAPSFSLILSICLGWKKHISDLFPIRKIQIGEVAKEYANFPKFNLPRALVNSVGQALPIWVLTPCFGLEHMGYLSLAMVAAFVPLNIIARACYQVLYQRIVENVQQGLSIRTILMKFTLWTGGIMLVGMTIVYIFVPQMVSVLFGEEWNESATIIRCLFPYLILIPFCGTLCFLSDVFAKQKIAMWMEAGYVAVMLCALIIGAHGLTFLDTVSTYAWIGFTFLSIQLIWFVSLIWRYEQTLSTH